MEDKNKLLEKAIHIAVNAHFGQVDKAGIPYIFHPLRVMQNCTNLDEKIVAILHDTIEDTNITPDYLIEEKFPQYIVDAVIALTKRQKESYEEFIKRITCNSLATAVKIQDIKDNMDVSRLSDITSKDAERLNKYAKALCSLRASIV